MKLNSKIAITDLKQNSDFKSHELIKWKNNPERKPLLLRGARQLGKFSI